MAKGKQISCTIDSDLYQFIEEVASKERRSVSEMGAIFIENAIKERRRNRKGKKDAKEI